jgi:hypothetical protein
MYDLICIYYINLLNSIFLNFFSVYRQGEIGSSWYVVLGGSLEARLMHTSQTSSTNAEKVRARNKTDFFPPPNKSSSVKFSVFVLTVNRNHQRHIYNTIRGMYFYEYINHTNRAVNYSISSS